MPNCSLLTGTDRGHAEHISTRQAWLLRFIAPTSRYARYGAPTVFSSPPVECFSTLVAQIGFHHAATGHQPGQICREFVGLQGLLGFAVLLGAEEEKLQLARRRQVEALAHEYLLTLANNQYRPFTAVVNLLIGGCLGSGITQHAGVFLVQFAGVNLGEFSSRALRPPGRKIEQRHRSSRSLLRRGRLTALYRVVQPASPLRG